MAALNLTPATAKATKPGTAAAHGLVACHICGTVCVDDAACVDGAEASVQQCPLCGGTLHSRKPFSVQQSWAWLLAGAIVYIPANLLPVMHTSVFSKTESSTIFDGILTLIELKSYPVALVVFVASIVVPVLKFMAIAFLLISIQFGLQGSAKDRLRLYRMTEFVGRWSMVDVFVVAILAALVQLGTLAQIDPGSGIVAFAATVIFTMLSALSIDPRLIWD